MDTVEQVQKDPTPSKKNITLNNEKSTRVIQRAVRQYTTEQLYSIRPSQRVYRQLVKFQKLLKNRHTLSWSAIMLESRLEKL